MNCYACFRVLLGAVGRNTTGVSKGRDCHSSGDRAMGIWLVQLAYPRDLLVTNCYARFRVLLGAVMVEMQLERVRAGTATQQIRGNE